MKVYRYTQLRYLQDALSYGIYASDITEVNDVYESKDIHYPEQYRICCMCKGYQQMLMWAHYGRHRECCVEYEVPDEWAGKEIREIDYIKKPVSRKNKNAKDVEESFFTKGNEWKYEKECRAVYHAKNANETVWRVKGEKVFLRATPTRVIFGVAAEHNERYQDALRLLKKFNERAAVKVEKMRIEDKRYRLKKDEQYDYRLECA